MYGFHKIPHLQQGVLKSDTETEYWNFAHANFHRGQPDLLCLIQRKKTPNQSTSDDLSMDMPTLSNSTTTTPQGQVLDVQAIVSGIAAIKRHQTTISAELNELKRSNQMLWQDAMAARTRHQKQQDTINKIVKFLAGVFGGQAKDAPVQDNSPQFHVPRRKPRLMIEDA
jgi:heat shock transcription factor